MANGNDGNNGNGKHPLGVFFQLVFVISLALIAWEIITEGSVLGESLTEHIMGLFKKAKVFPPNAEAFSLGLIAFFTGWAAKQFMRKK